MSFNLKLSSGSSESDLKDPTEEDLINAISTIKKDPENFLILDATKPVNAFDFIQATGFNGNTFYVEVQYAEGNVLCMYGNTVTENTLSNILIDFIANKAPNINEWEYVQDIEDHKFYYEYEFRKMIHEEGLFAIKCCNVPTNKIVLDTYDLQELLDYVKQNGLNSIFYYYGYIDTEKYDIYQAARKKDRDLVNIAKEDISEYENRIASIDLDRRAYLVAYCLHNGIAILIKLYAPWMRTLVPAYDFLDGLERKYVEKLDAIKSQREDNKDFIREQLREELLVNDEFHLCTNQKLRYDFMRRFLIKKENNKYKEAFLTNNGELNSYDVQMFADIVYAVYKQSLRKK